MKTYKSLIWSEYKSWSAKVIFTDILYKTDNKDEQELLEKNWVMEYGVVKEAVEEVVKEVSKKKK
jgi:hypothetical protein